MNFRKSLLTISLIFSSFLPLNGESILVHLETEDAQLPLYLAHFQTNRSTLSTSTLKELENVLRFDLHHNGSTTVTRSSPDLEILCRDHALGKADTISTWQALQVAFVATATIDGSELYLSLFDHGTETIHRFPAIPLTGNVNIDRRKIHTLSDGILNLLFGKEGISTSRILYTVKTKGTKGIEIAELWEADYDGGNAHQVSRENTLIVTPASLGKRHALYVSYKIGVPKIHQLPMDQEEKGRRLIQLQGNQLMPAVSPQGDLIAFISDAGGNPDLFIQPFDSTKGPTGKPRQIFAVPYAAQGSPTFSPDGKKIAFVSNKDGRPRIYALTIPAPGTRSNQIRTKLITKRNAESTAPSWSPDGTKLAYSSKIDRIRQIWVYNFSTQKEEQITKGPTNKENPAWAKDNQHLLYNTSSNASSELYLIDTKHPKPVSITKGPGIKRFPAWQR